ncbi:unnamed protein product [Rotaria magnacalcarata]|uniref:Uncharacterized protein n=1 Tax=Rotaria magnacalcarata TaxID=392030 RepID=A0A815ZZ28_9BILA|nr:unnamed protein product [Rotaria magnacalcarata]
MIFLLKYIAINWKYDPFQVLAILVSQYHQFVYQTLYYLLEQDFQVLMINLNDDSNKIKQHECCDGSVRVFNLDKQTFIKQFNMINISNNIETASLLVTNLINSSPCPCHTLFIVTYINGQLSNCLTFDVCIKQEKQKRFSSELISFNFKLFIKNAICSLVWNPIEHHLFTCSTMPVNEYAHVDIFEYIFKPKLTSSDKEEIEVEKMTTSHGHDVTQSKSTLKKKQNNVTLTASDTIEQLADRSLVLDNYVKRENKILKYDKLEKLDEILQQFFICIWSTTVPSNYSPYTSSNNQGAKQTLNTQSLATSMDYMNSSSQHVQFQNINSHYSISIAPDSMLSCDYPQNPTNLSSTPSTMSRVKSSDNLLDASLTREPKHMYFSSMMNNSNGMKPPSHYPIYFNDGRPPLLPPPPEAFYNTYVPSAMTVQQFNFQNPSPGEQLQFNNLETSPFYLSDDNEEASIYA